VELHLPTYLLLHVPPLHVSVPHLLSLLKELNRTDLTDQEKFFLVYVQIPSKGGDWVEF